MYSAAVADYTMLTYSSETESPKPWDAKKFAEIKGPVRNFKRDGISHNGCHITHDHCSVFLQNEDANGRALTKSAACQSAETMLLHCKA